MRVSTFLGLGHALIYLSAHGGAAAVSAHNLRMRARAFDGLARIKAKHPAALGDLEVIGARARAGPLVSPILTFTLPAPWTSRTFAKAMFDRGVVVKQAGRSAAPNEGGPTMPQHACRLSMHAFVSAADVDAAIDAVEAVLT